MELFQDSAHTGGDLVGLVMPAIIGANHQHHNLGVQLSIQVPMVKTPQDMLGAIPANPEIGRSEGRDFLRPHFFTLALPALGNGIAHKQNVKATLFRELIEVFMADEPPLFTGFRDN